MPISSSVVRLPSRAADRIGGALRMAYEMTGPCPGPEDVFLALRGLRTLAIRLEHHQKAALDVADYQGRVWATRRRPWIEWIHTVRDQGALIRNYTKWDDQPASPTAAISAGKVPDCVPQIRSLVATR